MGKSERICRGLLQMPTFNVHKQDVCLKKRVHTLKTEMLNVNLKGPMSEHSFKMSDCFF